MKIKLLQDIPVESEHGMTEGRIFEVIERGKGRNRPRYWVMGDVGEKVGILSSECEVIDE